MVFLHQYREKLRVPGFNELRPGDLDAYCNLVVALQQQGRLDQAIGAYRQAIAHKADCAEAINNIGIVRQLQGDLDESAS